MRRGVIAMSFELPGTLGHHPNPANDMAALVVDDPFHRQPAPFRGFVAFSG
jgi:hypothetical protein